MSLFSGLEKKAEKHIVEAAIDKLGRDGTAGVAGIGDLQYDYATNMVSMDADPKIVAKVRKAWEKYHGE